MKTRIFQLIALAIIALSSCDKMPENGPLDGLWQLTQITTDGKQKNVTPERLYLSFQLKLFMLGSDHYGPRTFFGRFERNADEIRFYQFTRHSDYSGVEQGIDTLLTDEKHLHIIERWGYPSVDCRFRIEELNSTTMKLSNGSRQLLYKKF